MTGEPITVTGLRKIGEGVQRPEQVLVARDGRVYASDKASAVAEIRSDGSVRRIGNAGGEPNGIALDSKGRFIIANFGLGQLQRLNPGTGEIEVLLADRIEGRLLKWLNYVLVDSSGALWASVCTATEDFDHTIAYGVADGFLVRGRPGRL